VVHFQWENRPGVSGVDCVFASVVRVARS
jgi:hypothetical protein